MADDRKIKRDAALDKIALAVPLLHDARDLFHAADCDAQALNVEEVLMCLDEILED